MGTDLRGGGKKIAATTTLPVTTNSIAVTAALYATVTKHKTAQLCF